MKFNNIQYSIMIFNDIQYSMNINAKYYYSGGQDGDMADGVLLISRIFNIHYSIMIFNNIQWISIQNIFLLAGRDGDMTDGVLLISRIFNIHYSIMIFDNIQWISMQNTFLLEGQDGDMADGVLLILAKCVPICFLTTNHAPTSSCYVSVPCFFLQKPKKIVRLIWKFHNYTFFNIRHRHAMFRSFALQVSSYSKSQKIVDLWKFHPSTFLIKIRPPLCHGV